MAVKITLENFFDIDSEEFELSSFMVFCGDNSSGKTHLVKLLSTVDNVLRDRIEIRRLPPPSSRILGMSKLQFLESCLEYDLEKEYGEVMLENQRKEEIYDIIEEYLNMAFDKRTIFLKAFPANVMQKLGKIKLQFTDRADIGIYIERINEVGDIVGGVRERNKRYRIQVEINKTKLKNILMVSKNNSFSESKRSIVRIILRLIILLSYKANFPSDNSRMLYLPASREAYTRDYDYFLPIRDPFLEDDFEIEENELYENEPQKNNHSDDPFVERYVQQFISSFKWEKSNNNQEIVDFLESNMLKAKVMFNEGKLRYKLENDQEISTIQASSMQNEYSFFARLIQTDRYKSLVIEEPEAHLSLPNAIRFTFVLLALHQKGYNIWITTHNTFIADTINNFILMSKLEQEKQLQFLKQFQIDSMLTHIEPQRVDEINALYIKKEGIHYLEKNNRGIIFKQFIKQINQFVDLTAELQNEFWEDDDE